MASSSAITDESFASVAADLAGESTDDRDDVGRFDRVLVAVDGDADDRTIGVAVSLAASYGARVDALSVVRMNASVDHWDVVVERREDAAEAALDAVGEAAADAAVPVEKRLRYGDPAEEIALSAAGDGADLVVMGDPDRGRLRRFLSPKSVTDRVRRSASVPVLTVPAVDSASDADDSADAPSLPGVDPTA